MKKKILFFISFALFFLKDTNLYSQDIHLSQTWMTPLLLNPAQAGTEENIRAFINYKNQWSSVATPYSTSVFSLDMVIPQKEKKEKNFSAVALTVYYDNAGDAEMKTLQGNLAYAYHVYLTENSTLGAALYGGFAQRSIDLSSFEWMNQYNGTSFDPSLPSGEQRSSMSYTYFDLGGGIHYQYGKGERYMTANDQVHYSGGVAVFHVNRPQNSFYASDEKLDIKTTTYANAILGISNSNFSILPSIVYSQQGKLSEMLLGSLFRYSFKDESKYTGLEHATAFYLGIHYRSQDAVIPSLLFEISHYEIGISYDANVSGLKTASSGQGGFELSFRFISFDGSAVASTPRN